MRAVLRPFGRFEKTAGVYLGIPCRPPSPCSRGKGEDGPLAPSSETEALVDIPERAHAGKKRPRLLLVTLHLDHKRIEAVESFAHIGGGKGGYWEDRGYQWYAGI